MDELTPVRRAKPKEVMSAAVWIEIGDSKPVSADELTFAGLDTQTPFEKAFDAEQIGQVAYYRLRWVSPRGEAGPWSDVVSAKMRD